MILQSERQWQKPLILSCIMCPSSRTPRQSYRAIFVSSVRLGIVHSRLTHRCVRCYVWNSKYSRAAAGATCRESRRASFFSSVSRVPCPPSCRLPDKPAPRVCVLNHEDVELFPTNSAAFGLLLELHPTSPVRIMLLVFSNTKLHKKKKAK